jgi:hypothetical protein
MGVGDRYCHKGQARIATKETRDSSDEIIVQKSLKAAMIGNLVYKTNFRFGSL